MVASEAVPYAKTGGLADVLGSLPRALGRLGHTVDVVIPRYRDGSAGREIDRLTLTFDGKARDIGLWADATAERVRTLFVDAPEYFDRERLYGVGNDDYPDNAVRFALLARA